MSESFDETHAVTQEVFDETSYSSNLLGHRDNGLRSRTTDDGPCFDLRG